MGSCRFFAADAGLVFTFPLPIGGRLRNRIGLMVAAASATGLRDAISYSFSGNTPLTRAPFSNMVADYMVTGPQFRGRGLGGLQAAGFWNNAWTFDGASGWSAVDCL
jgi:hypothetical protein